METLTYMKVGQELGNREIQFSTVLPLGTGQALSFLPALRENMEEAKPTSDC